MLRSNSFIKNENIYNYIFWRVKQQFPEKYNNIMPYLVDEDYSIFRCADRNLLSELIIVKASLSKNKIILCTEIYEDYIEDFLEMQENNSKNRIATNSVHTMVKNVELMYDNDNFLLIELIFYLVDTLPKDYQDVISKTQLIYKFTLYIQTVIKNWVSKQGLNIGKNQVDLRPIIHLDLDVKKPLILNAQLIRSVLIKTESPQKGEVSELDFSQKKLNNFLDTNLEYISLKDENILMDTLINKIVSHFLTILFTLEDRNKNKYYSYSTYNTRELIRERKLKANLKDLKPILRWEDQKSRVFITINHSTNLVNDIEKLLDVKLVKSNFLTNAINNMDQANENPSYKEDFFNRRSLIKKNLKNIHIRQDFSKKGYKFLKIVDSINNAKMFFDKKYFDYLKIFLNDSTLIRDYFEYDHTFVLNFLKNPEFKKNLDGKIVDIFSKKDYKTPTTIKGLIEVIDSILMEVLKFTHILKYNINDLKLNMSGRDWFKNIYESIVWFKLGLEKILSKARQVQIYIDTITVMLKFPIYSLGFYLYSTYDFRLRKYVIGNLSLDSNKLCRWLVYSVDYSYDAFKRISIKDNKLNKYFFAPIDRYKNSIELLCLVEALFKKIGDRFYALKAVKEFLEKIQHFKDSYIFHTKLYNKEDIRAISLLNIIIVISFEAYKKKNGNLHNVTHNNIFIYMTNYVLEQVMIKSPIELYQVLINAKNDFTFLGNTIDLYNNVHWNLEIKIDLQRDSRFQGAVLISLLCFFKKENAHLYDTFNTRYSGRVYDPYMTLKDILDNIIEKQPLNVKRLKRVKMYRCDIPRSLIKVWFMRKYYGAKLVNWDDEYKKTKFFKEKIEQYKDIEDINTIKKFCKIYYDALEIFLEKGYTINLKNFKLPLSKKNDTADNYNLYTFDGVKLDYTYYKLEYTKTKSVDNYNILNNKSIEMVKIINKILLNWICKLLEIENRKNISFRSVKVLLNYEPVEKVLSKENQVYENKENISKEQERLLIKKDIKLSTFFKKKNEIYNNLLKLGIDYLKILEIIQICELLDRRLINLKEIPYESKKYDIWDSFLQKLNKLLTEEGCIHILIEKILELKREFRHLNFLDVVPASKVKLMTKFIDIQKSRQSFFPNFIHTIDSLILRNIHFKGFNDFNSIHDSYKTHPSLVDFLLYYYNLALSETLLPDSNEIDILREFLRELGIDIKENDMITREDLMSNSLSLI